MEPRIYIKNGDLSGYGLACGYVQKQRSKTHWKELYMEHHRYHVRSGKIGDNFENWETFEINQLGKAQKHFKAIVLLHS